MSFVSFFRRFTGREQQLRFSQFAYRHGLVVNTPMRIARNDEVIGAEYIRSSSLELVAREINERGVAGAVAELGVYQGEFAALINVAFPDRRLYLFDTFAGFDKDQVTEDLSRNRIPDALNDFSQTSVELVMARMKFKHNCVAMPGLFPDSAVSCPETQYAFVSIDCDLYQPIYDGLSYFYPRLSSGGYIFMHDYNNPQYLGPREALKRFASELPISYFPLTDASGSAVIYKP